jgi:hypothetical protein
VEIDEKKYPHPFLPFGYDSCNVKFFLNPFVISNKTASHQFSCKIQAFNVNPNWAAFRKRGALFYRSQAAE